MCNLAVVLLKFQHEKGFVNIPKRKGKIRSRYIPSAAISRSAIWSFLCTSHYPYPPGMRTRCNVHFVKGELQSLSRAALSSFFGIFTTSAYSDLKKQFLLKSQFDRVIWACSIPTALPSLCSLCSQSDLFMFVDVGGRCVALTAFLSMVALSPALLWEQQMPLSKPSLPECCLQLEIPIACAFPGSYCNTTSAC